MFRQLGVVSLMFCELSKIISQKYTMPEITYMVRISSWNFVLLPKAWLEFLISTILLYTNFERIFWRACKMLVKQSQDQIFLDKFFKDLQNIDIYFHCGTYRQYNLWTAKLSLITYVLMMVKYIKNLEKTINESWIKSAAYIWVLLVFKLCSFLAPVRNLQQ